LVELRVAATPRERAERQENSQLFPSPAPHWLTLRHTGRFDIPTNPPRLGRTAFCSDIGHTPISYSSSSQGVTGFRSQRTQVFGGDITEVLQLPLRPAFSLSRAANGVRRLPSPTTKFPRRTGQIVLPGTSSLWYFSEYRLCVWAVSPGLIPYVRRVVN
jgi:hypothetical protein